jgi:beta-glucosidase
VNRERDEDVKMATTAAQERAGPAEAAEVTFPEGFLWGAATSAYQVEGAVAEDGRAPSIWDVFSHTEGRTRDGHTGDVADDHYHRYREDVALMRSLGLMAYRFSVAWPRVLPTGSGTVNEAGLDFYRRLVDELLGAGVEPHLTVYHWDLPQALQEAGGWPARETAQRFADYAAIVFDALHDRVRFWTTLNEPWCSSLLAYADGVHAPGIREPRQATRAIHHLLLGHGLALKAMRAIDPARDIGIVLNLQPIRAGEPDPPAELLDNVRRVDGLRNRVWTDPLLRGRYPDDVAADLEAFGSLPVRDGDLDLIAGPLDFLGINYYNDDFLITAPGRTIPHTPGVIDVAGRDPGPDATDMRWPVTPDGLRDLIVTLKASYPDLPPIHITENGVAYDDAIAPDGGIHDERRIAYLDGHLRAVAAAIDAGVDVRGYFQWTLMDNFEWSHGYHMRFGLIHVDYDTLARTPRDSASWYRGVIARNGLSARA